MRHERLALLAVEVTVPTALAVSAVGPVRGDGDDRLAVGSRLAAVGMHVELTDHTRRGQGAGHAAIELAALVRSHPDLADDVMLLELEPHHVLISMHDQLAEVAERVVSCQDRGREGPVVRYVALAQGLLDLHGHPVDDHAVEHGRVATVEVEPRFRRAGESTHPHGRELVHAVSRGLEQTITTVARALARPQRAVAAVGLTIGVHTDDHVERVGLVAHVARSLGRGRIQVDVEATEHQKHQEDVTHFAPPKEIDQ